MRRNRQLGLVPIAVAAMALAACSERWIQEPSPQVKSLVNDLQLEGYECTARTSDIKCVQAEPNRERQSAKCDSKNGCVAQADHLLFNIYYLKQAGNGIPEIKHEVDRRVDNKFFGMSK